MTAINSLEVKTRRAIQADMDFVYQLMSHYLKEYFNKYTQEGWSHSKFISGFDPERITVVESNGIRFGFADYELFPNKIRFRTIVISEGYQNKGIGTHLEEKMCTVAKQFGIPLIEGKVFKENPSLNWFKKRGFTIHSEIPEEHSYLVRKIIEQNGN